MEALNESLNKLNESLKALEKDKLRKEKTIEREINFIKRLATLGINHAPKYFHLGLAGDYCPTVTFEVPTIVDAFNLYAEFLTNEAVEILPSYYAKIGNYRAGAYSYETFHNHYEKDEKVIKEECTCFLSTDSSSSKYPLTNETELKFSVKMFNNSTPSIQISIRFKDARIYVRQAHTRRAGPRSAITNWVYEYFGLELGLVNQYSARFSTDYDSFKFVETIQADSIEDVKQLIQACDTN
jgi:hypothetical protein